VVVAVVACLACPPLFVVAAGVGLLRRNRRVVVEASEAMAVVASSGVWRGVVAGAGAVVAMIRCVVARVIGVLAVSATMAVTDAEPVARPIAIIGRPGGARAPRRAGRTRLTATAAASRTSEGGCVCALPVLRVAEPAAA
jgi:hypothetical protein